MPCRNKDTALFYFKLRLQSYCVSALPEQVSTLRSACGLFYFAKRFCSGGRTVACGRARCPPAGRTAQFFLSSRPQLDPSRERVAVGLRGVVPRGVGCFREGWRAVMIAEKGCRSPYGLPGRRNALKPEESRFIQWAVIKKDASPPSRATRGCGKNLARVGLNRFPSVRRQGIPEKGRAASPKSACQAAPPEVRIRVLWGRAAMRAAVRGRHAGAAFA